MIWLDACVIFFLCVMYRSCWFIFWNVLVSNIMKWDHSEILLDACVKLFLCVVVEVYYFYYLAHECIFSSIFLILMWRSILTLFRFVLRWFHILFFINRLFFLLYPSGSCEFVSVRWLNRWFEWKLFGWLTW
jgi:hypothetical protein